MPIKFEIGRLVATAGVGALMEEGEDFRKFVAQSLSRHIQGDWGNLSDEDKQLNDASVNDGSRILSSYEADSLPKIWIITEADRSATTVLFPDEY